ncbi:A-kinase anchor protein 7-like [Artemia franciscana]|uniref:A-kinase anchor protein 7-like phosphoesterase domain-containing protein n=1 Tax=Artemia franciscana TaxID=6661 RepID=A0AA88L7H6_ARTSF|nr:hypothetical protein QYM36_010428 [Artemia franciscana]
MDTNGENLSVVNLFEETICQQSESTGMEAAKHDAMDLYEDVLDLGEAFEIAVKSETILETQNTVRMSRNRQLKQICQVKEKPQKMKKFQPNFFFAIQVKHVQIKDQATVVQNHIIKKDARLSRALIKPASFHITLGVVHLKNEDEIERTKNALTKALSQFQHEFVKNPLQLAFQGLGTFRGQILYAKLKNEEVITARLSPVLEKLIEEVGNCGIQFEDKRQWKPHLTILKLSKNPKLLRKVKRLHPSLMSDYSNIEFGYELVKSIQLCSMNGPKSEDGYYAKVAEFCFDRSTFIQQEPSLLEQKLMSLRQATSTIKRRIHLLVSSNDEKKPKLEEKESQSQNNAAKYVAAAGVLAVGALIATKTLRRAA